MAFHHVLDHGQASRSAHIAAECAGRQSPIAFWHLHAVLYARQGELWQAGPPLLTQMAESVGLDGAEFSACMADLDVAAHVEALDQARRAGGIRQRPSFDVNGRLIEGSLPYSAFVSVFGEATP